MSNTSFFEEMKRRNIYKVGIAYAIAAWLLLQVIDVVVPLMEVPEWIPKFVLLLLGIGFPIALIFAWAFEMTPEGLKREKDVDRTESITRETGQRLNRMIIAVLVLAVGILLVDKFFLSNVTNEVTPDVAALDGAAEATPSIAVLPFANMSADESSTYFSDGLADTLLHMLAQIREIRVAARTSSFQFRDQNTDITEIAKTLGVGTILEGSVQRAGNKVRVTAQLIEADTGFHLWSGNYDRDLDDIFAIQDEIANEVVAALKISLLGESAERLTHRETESLEAYTAYLLGVDDLNEFSFESLSKAEAHFREAVTFDPGYALAWARLGETYIKIQHTGAGALDEMVEAARDAASKALALDDELSTALAVLGQAEKLSGNLTVAEQLLQKAVIAGPNDPTAKVYYAELLWNEFRGEEALDLLDDVLALDPLSAEAHSRRTVGYTVMGQFDAGLAQSRLIMEINPNSPVGYYREAEILYAQGHWAAAAVAAMRAIEVDPADPELATMIGDAYLSMELLADTERWYDRSTEIDATHAVSRSNRLAIHLYNDDIAAADSLARDLLRDGVEFRQGTDTMILLAIWRQAEVTGRYQEALEFLEAFFPRVFGDEPGAAFSERYHRLIIGGLMLAAGETERGERLVREIQERGDEASEVYTPGLLRVRASAILGDKEGALERLRVYLDKPTSPIAWPIFIRTSPDFETIRNEPDFVEFIADLEANAAKQRELLPELLAAQQ